VGLSAPASQFSLTDRPAFHEHFDIDNTDEDEGLALAPWH
jgi:hypothetical protein